MKRRILAILLCACIAMTGIVRSYAADDLYGDANRDGKITTADAAFILRYCSGYEYRRMTTRHKILSDIDCNGAVEAADAAIILRHVVQLNPIQQVATDAELLQLLNQQALLYDDNMTEWAARFIQSVSNSKVKKVLYAGAKYLGKSYGTGTDQYDCSRFVSIAFKDAGISRSVYPQKSSNDTLNWFRTNHPEQLHETDEYSWKDWKPGCVLIYINDTTGKGSHLSLYVGEIDGEPIVMESRRSGCDGVRIGYLMGSSDSWDLVYYVDPLG